MLLNPLVIVRTAVHRCVHPTRLALKTVNLTRLPRVDFCTVLGVPSSEKKRVGVLHMSSSHIGKRRRIVIPADIFILTILLRVSRPIPKLESDCH